MPRSQANNRIFPLVAGGTFTGTAESTAAGVAISVSVLVPTECTLTIEQSYDKATWFISEQYPIPANAHKTVQQAVGLEFFRVILVNNGITQTFCHLISTLSTSLTQNVNIRNLEETRDKVAMWGQDETAVQHPVLTDASGALIVSSSGGGSSVVSVSNFPAVQEVSGEVAVSNYSPFSGVNTDFAFYPDASNSTVAIYADGQQPTATNQAGWVYTNNGTAPNKINWYVFQDVTLPQYLVSDMESIYFVITQLPTATTLPFVGFYTMPNGINDVVPNFAKSKLVFAPSGAVPTTQGEYLFYVGADPTDSRGVPIRPEITNRYELTFVAGQSSKTLAQASGERLSLATLSTNSSDAVGANYFLFQQYGIQWAKTTVRLPVDNDRLLTTETNSSAISTTLTSLNSKVTACNTGAIAGSVSITGDITEMNSTSIYNTLVAVNSKIISCDTNNVTLSNTNGIKSFAATNTRVKRAISTVANALLSINYYNDAGSINFILLYDLGFASVTVGTTPPIAVFALNKNHGDTIDLHRLLIGPAITLAVAGDYDGSTDPHGAGAYLTVSTLTSN